MPLESFSNILRVAFQGTPHNRTVMALESYFDETEEGHVLFIAGVIADSSHWAGFRREWNHFLSRCPNMTDCLATGARVETGAFRGIPEDKRRAMASRAVRLTRRWIEAGVVASVNVSEFDQIVSPIVRKGFGDAYTFCCTMAMHLMASNEKVKGLPGDILYVFERGGPGWKKASKHLQKFDTHPEIKAFCRYKNHLFMGKSEAAPLQAADVLANLVCKTYRQEKTLLGELHPLLESLLSDGQNTPVKWKHFDPEAIRGVLAETEGHMDRFHLRSQLGAAQPTNSSSKTTR
jgi:hypothetical protein